MSTTTITGTTTLGVSLTSTAVLNETVANYGTINTAPTMETDGVFFSSSGEVINGSASDTAALIESDYFGIQIPGPVGSVDNFGTILAPSGGLAGVNLRDVSAANIVRRWISHRPLREPPSRYRTSPVIPKSHSATWRVRAS